MICRVCKENLVFLRALDKRGSLAVHEKDVEDYDQNRYERYEPVSGTQRKLRQRLENEHKTDTADEVTFDLVTGSGGTVSTGDNPDARLLNPEPQIEPQEQLENDLVTDETPESVRVDETAATVLDDNPMQTTEEVVQDIEAGREPVTFEQLAEASVRRNEPNRFEVATSTVGNNGERIERNAQGETIEQYHKRLQDEVAGEPSNY